MKYFIWNILESQTITMFVAEDVVSLQIIVFFLQMMFFRAT